MGWAGDLEDSIGYKQGTVLSLGYDDGILDRPSLARKEERCQQQRKPSGSQESEESTRLFWIPVRTDPTCPAVAGRQEMARRVGNQRAVNVEAVTSPRVGIGVGPRCDNQRRAVGREDREAALGVAQAEHARDHIGEGELPVSCDRQRITGLGFELRTVIPEPGKEQEHD